MIRLLLAVFLALSMLSPGFAQTSFPVKSVKLVVPFPPGGSTDISARLVANKLSERWGQAVVVENKPGAGANIGATFVAKSPPDGYTLLVGASALSISPAVFKQLGYDAASDLAPISMISTIPNVLVVNREFPARSTKEFFAKLKANPGKYNYSVPGPASGQRMTFELIKQETGVDIVMVPYNGGAPALQALLGGQVQAAILNVVEATPHVKSNSVRALAVTTAKRSSMLPDVPTLAEEGFPQIDVSVWQALFAPAGTPSWIIRQIQSDIASVLTLPDVKLKLSELGMAISSSSPEALGDFLRQDLDLWKKVGRAAGIHPE